MRSPGVGISEQGEWVFAVFGERLMPADLLETQAAG